MKKTILLTLVLIMALGACVSARAFTSTPWESDKAVQFYVGIRLVDAQNGPLGVNFTAPAANRGYLKNEIVCAIATLYVPKNQDVSGRGYEYLAFSARNVSIDVMENRSGSDISLRTSANIPEAGRVFTQGPGGVGVSNEIRFDVSNIPANVSRDQEYHFAFFGKVLDDNAFMNVLLTKAKEFATPAPGSPEEAYANALGLNSSTTHLLFDEDYNVFRTVIDEKVYYTVANGALTKTLFQVSAAKTNKSDSMSIYYADGAEWYEVVYMGSERPAFRQLNGTDFIMESDTGERRTRYNALISIYEDVIKDVFGMDIKYKGNSLSEKYFTDYGNVNDAFSEVALEPWYADVVVPPEIEITPPKTGGAYSALGIALVTGAALALIMLKRVKPVD